MSHGIWKHRPDLDQLRELGRNTAIEHLGIEFTEVGDDYLAGRMHVDHRTRQPFGLLHGGASALLAETLGSIAANHCLDPAVAHAVGLEVSANHVRSARSGWVRGVARPLHVGRTTQLWDVRIHDEHEKPVCVARLVVSVLRKGGEQR